MAKINNVGLNLGQKIANPFKTSRSMSTPNPFQYANFEGNSLPFADVLMDSSRKNTSKLKMISASVAGSMNKLHSLLPESIVNFVNRVREGVSNAWNYAKNTNISDVKGIKAINNVMNADILDIGKGISDKMAFLNTDVADIRRGISERISFLNTDVTEIGKGLSEKWAALISKVQHNKITKDTSVNELRDMWLNEIALSSKEAA